MLDHIDPCSKTEGHEGQFKLDHIDPCSKTESHAGQFMLDHTGIDHV